jgi:hypothetical protein
MTKPYKTKGFPYKNSCAEACLAALKILQLDASSGDSECGLKPIDPYGLMGF